MRYTNTVDEIIAEAEQVLAEVKKELDSEESKALRARQRELRRTVKLTPKQQEEIDQQIKRDFEEIERKTEEALAQRKHSQVTPVGSKHFKKHDKMI